MLNNFAPGFLSFFFRLPRFGVAPQVGDVETHAFAWPLELGVRSWGCVGNQVPQRRERADPRQPKRHLIAYGRTQGNIQYCFGSAAVQQNKHEL